MIGTHHPRPPAAVLVLTLCCMTALACLGSGSASAGSVHCGKAGVWVQILGSGGPEIDDGRASAGYVLWIDDSARLLVDPGPGTALRFDESGARIEDLDAIAFTQLGADHAGDLAALLVGARESGRDRPLPVLGPDGTAERPSMRTFLERAVGPEGLYPDLADFLTFRSGSFKVTPTNVPSTGSRRWARFGTEHIRLSAVPVHHGTTPTIAWRAQAGDVSVTFAGDFNNEGNLMQQFARDTDALIVHHAIADNTRGELRDLFVTPGQIGRIAAEANARMLILGHRTKRTRGIESQTEASIRRHYKNALIFANDLECWGL